MPKRTKYSIYGTEHGQFKPSALNIQGEPKFQGRQAPVYRSSYEKQCFYLLEQNPGVIWWKSESSLIPYINPLDGKRHTYYVDLTFRAVDRETQELTTFLVEVKPKSQTQPPKMGARKRKKTLETETKVYITNIAKWNAAYEFCKKHGYKFYIWTEVDMFPYIPQKEQQ
jgi:hypothetical protein